jgi:hypothetical protein
MRPTGEAAMPQDPGRQHWESRQMTGTSEDRSGIRTLDETELDAVNGGSIVETVVQVVNGVVNAVADGVGFLCGSLGHQPSNPNWRGGGHS